MEKVSLSVKSKEKRVTAICYLWVFQITIFFGKNYETIELHSIQKTCLALRNRGSDNSVKHKPRKKNCDYYWENDQSISNEKKYKEVPPEISEVKLKKSRRTFSFTTLFGIEEKWMVGTIKLKVINSIFNIRKTKNKKSSAYYDDIIINNELEFLNGTKSSKEDIMKTI